MGRELELEKLLEAGAHFGHQTHKWNPKMKPYVYGERNGIYIIDLQKTLDQAKKAYEFLRKTASEGKLILFVGTKRQASESVRKAAERCGAFFVTYRWLGGMLTNYKTIFLSIDKLRKVEKMKETGDFGLLTKKERSKIDKEVIKLEKNLGGIKNMRKLPGAVFIVDPDCERIAVKESNNLNIPVIAITDTNCDPTGIDYVVPGNDDAIKSISLFAEYFADSVSEGLGNIKVQRKEDITKDVNLEKEIISKYDNDIDLKGSGETES
ncbi:MAG: 30S ribosomal protein S2 [Bacteriovoracaceae bacterium]|nr:30S ribosomal protein S2 [Bacteriovoracaceae bacterium]